MKKNKKGAASFYIVAFSTLILIIIAMSFAAVIISEMTRTSNDDLAQSAYDSALAGIEDAKLAYYNYRNCLKKNPNIDMENLKEPNPTEAITCEGIIWYMKNPACNMVSAILGRSSDTVAVEESNVTGNNMQQYYTCVKIDDTPNDVQGSLSSSKMLKVIEPKFDTIQASDIVELKIRWYSDKNIENSGFNFANFDNTGTDGVTYKGLGQALLSAPPTIFVAVIQTSETGFNFGSFDVSSNGETNRGMVFLTPTENKIRAGSSKANNYRGAYINNKNYINKSVLVKSNDKTSSINLNLPYVVYCENPSDMSGNDYACETTIELPNPIGGNRSNDTFRIVLGLPYGAPDTDFSLAFLCENGKDCNSDEGTLEGDASVATLRDVQIEIDSTGKANDLFRRVEARLEKADNQNLSIMGPLELLGTGDNVLSGVVGSGSGSSQTPAITCEWNFYGSGNSPTCSE